MAGNNGVTADIAGMQAAQPHFEAALQETGNAYTSMQDQADLLEGSWHGDAAVIFKRALNEWLQNCNIVRQQLQNVTDKLEANTHQYQNVHANTADAATGLQKAMSGGLPGF